MKKLLFLLVLIFTVGGLLAEVAPGENILINGVFDADEIDQATGLPTQNPTFWSATGALKNISFSLKNAPAGKGIVKFEAPDGLTSPEVTMRQMDLTLVPGGKYRISALRIFILPVSGVSVK